MVMRALRLLSVIACVGACEASVAPGRLAASGSLHGVKAGANADPTVRGARLVPEIVDRHQDYGTEPGGGTRAMTANLRMITSADGSVVIADDPLPQVPHTTIALPDRLGGGFLFVLGSTVWRSDRWLGEPKPIYTSYDSIQGVAPGLDRVYIRVRNTYLAIDGRSGKVLDLGPWPQSPFVSEFAAVDGWRAAAIADLRGMVVTSDAGATWQTLALPMVPRRIVPLENALAVGGLGSAQEEAWFELRGDGTAFRLESAPREAKGIQLSPSIPKRHYLPGGFPSGFSTSTRPSPTGSASSTQLQDSVDANAHTGTSRTFGVRPLAAAIEDGFSLGDGTAVVARDGALGRVRLEDGALVEIAKDAFPLPASRCHALSLARPEAPGAFGFVCGEPRGQTIIYAYDPAHGQLNARKRFARPRVVTSSGNGAISVRGPCSEDAEGPGLESEATPVPDVREDAGNTADSPDSGAMPNAPPRPVGPHPYCILGHDNVWREVRVHSNGINERLVVLTDGRIVVLSPPADGHETALITVLEKGGATTLPVLFPKVAADIARVLKYGVWLDGFEQRRPNVVGGWVEAAGTMLGIEIALDGRATVGQFIRDAGRPFVAGRYGLGWTASRRGFETTDGGMTWTALDLPEPVKTAPDIERRACGPIGCIAAGWLRVGWGVTKPSQLAAAPAPFRGSSTPPLPAIALACDPASPAMRVAGPRPVSPAPRPIPASRSTPSAIESMPKAAEMPPFFAQASPTTGPSERGMAFDSAELIERYPRLGSLARIYAWGPTNSEWETQGKWQVAWLSPFAGWPDARKSLPALPSQTILEFTKVASPFGARGALSSSLGFSQLAAGDDDAHGLLLVRRASRAELVPFELEADRVPLEIRRTDGEPFTAIDAVVRAAGRWFLATPNADAFAPSTIVWEVDGSVARELVRIPRSALETGRPNVTKLARRSDGRGLGLIVDGQTTAERNVSTRWVIPIDLENGHVGEASSLGYADLAGRTLEPCSDDLVGWVFDTSLPGASIRVHMPRAMGAMQSLYARLRLGGSRSCVERLSGTYESRTPSPASDLTTSTTSPKTPGKHAEVSVAALLDQVRYPLRCTLAKSWP